MKRVFLLLAVMLMIIGLVAPAALAVPPPADKDGCYTIQGGTITDSLGNTLTTGYDEFGYNYQAHMFAGLYDGFDRVWGNDSSDYADDFLIMKWSEDWLANVDCNDDGKLDRGTSGVSLGWLTNHIIGDYVDADGNVQHYTNFVKIVWTGPGSPLWNEYTVIEEVYNDPAAGFNGLLTKLGAPGLGLNDHWTTD